jgi:hypothetical protein
MARGMLTGPGPQGLGSGLAERNAWEGKDTPSRECLWIIGRYYLSSPVPKVDIFREKTKNSYLLKQAAD